MAQGTFATLFGCLDGRATPPAVAFLRDFLHVDFVDVVTEPGPDRVLLVATPDQRRAIMEKLLVSVNAHHSCTIVIAAHHECAGNPVSREDHLVTVRQCAQLIESWRLDVRVIGLWINDAWQAEVICDTASVVASA